MVLNKKEDTEDTLYKIQNDSKLSIKQKQQLLGYINDSQNENRLNEQKFNLSNLFSYFTSKIFN